MTELRRGAMVMAEVFKLLRAEAHSAVEVARHLGISDSAASSWLRELDANGMLVCTTAQHGRGHPTHVYRLAPQWGGKA